MLHYPLLFRHCYKTVDSHFKKTSSGRLTALCTTCMEQEIDRDDRRQKKMSVEEI